MSSSTRRLASWSSNCASGCVSDELGADDEVDAVAASVGEEEVARGTASGSSGGVVVGVVLELDVACVGVDALLVGRLFPVADLFLADLERVSGVWCASDCSAAAALAALLMLSRGWGGCSPRGRSSRASTDC